VHERAGAALAEAESLAALAGTRLRHLFPGWQVRTEAVADPPARAIIKRCQEWRPDLTVVGSHGRTALGRVFLRSVSQKVLSDAANSVRVARGREVPENEPVKLVLGTNGSPESDRMIRAVAARRWPPDTAVKLVTAYEAFHKYSVEPDVQIDRIRDTQTVARRRLEEAGLRVIPVITGEDPKSFLVRAADEWNADCIFLGAKGHSLIDRLLLGSVSFSVAARAHCSVEVVRYRAGQGRQG
jgi:nucleotide-binding universal stress UspA family protein